MGKKSRAMDNSANPKKQSNKKVARTKGEGQLSSSGSHLVTHTKSSNDKDVGTEKGTGLSDEEKRHKDEMILERIRLRWMRRKRVLTHNT